MKGLGLKVLGWLLLLLGIAALPLPGPGAFIIFGAMFVLALLQIRDALGQLPA